MKKIFAFLIALFLALPAFSQTQVYQSGVVTSGDPVVWTANRFIGDATLLGGYNQLLVTSTTPALCANDAVTTGQYHQLCLGALNAAGTAGALNYGAFGGASTLPFVLSVNGGNASLNGSALTLGAVSSQGSLVIAGSTSGSNTIRTSNAAGTVTTWLPITNGTAGQVRLSGGGSAPDTWGTPSGSTSTFATTSGTLNSGHCIQIDAGGNLIDSGGSCASSGVNPGTAGNVPYYATTSSSLSPNLDLNMSSAALTVGRAGVSQGSVTVTGAGAGGLTLAVPSSVTSYTLTWPSAVPASGQVPMATNGTGTLAWKYPGAACCTNQTTSFNAAVNTWYTVDTTGGAVTMTLPASPGNGDKVQWTDAKNNFATANLVLARNGNNIMNLAQNMTVSTNNGNAGVVWDSTNLTWSLY